jgi:hypothetical protein
MAPVPTPCASYPGATLTNANVAKYPRLHETSR